MTDSTALAATQIIKGVQDIYGKQWTDLISILTLYLGFLTLIVLIVAVVLPWLISRAQEKSFQKELAAFNEKITEKILEMQKEYKDKQDIAEKAYEEKMNDIKSRIGKSYTKSNSMLLALQGMIYRQGQHYGYAAYLFALSAMSYLNASWFSNFNIAIGDLKELLSNYIFQTDFETHPKLEKTIKKLVESMIDRNQEKKLDVQIKELNELCESAKTKPRPSRLPVPPHFTYN